MTRHSIFRTKIIAGSAALAIAAVSPAAWASTETSVDINASAYYATNPFLLTSGDTETASFSITAIPRVKIEDEVTRYELAGSFQHVEYLKRYSSTQNVSIEGTGWQRFDPRTELNIAAALSSTLTNSTNFGGLIVGLPGQLPNPTTLPILDDITLNGIRQRSNVARMSADLTHKPSAFDSVSVGVDAGVVRYGKSSISQEYNYAGTSLGYSRTLNDRVSIGATVSLLDTDYRYVRFGDGTVISPQLTLTAKLDARWSLSAAAGVSITKTSLLVGNDTRTALSGSLGVCRQGERDNFCLFGVRAATPTSFGGIQNQTSVSTTYSNRLTARDNLQLSAFYAQVSAPSSVIGRSVKSLSGRASLDHRLTERLAAFVSAGYADTFERGLSRRANATVSVGVSYRLGGRR